VRASFTNCFFESGPAGSERVGSGSFVPLASAGLAFPSFFFLRSSRSVPSASRLSATGAWEIPGAIDVEPSPFASRFRFLSLLSFFDSSEAGTGIEVEGVPLAASFARSFASFRRLFSSLLNLGLISSTDIVIVMVKGTDQTSGRKGQFQLQRTEIFCEMPRVLVEENCQLGLSAS